MATVRVSRCGKKFSNFQFESVGCIRSVFVLRNGVNTIGRNPKSSIYVESTYCSRDHCTITVVNDEVRLADHSANGTFVNQSKIKVSRCLAIGDMIGIGCSLVDPVELMKSSQYLVFRLNRMDAVGDIVELSDNEDDHVICLDSDDDVAVSNSADNTSTESDSSDDDDTDNASMQMHASACMEMKQEMLDLDDYLADMPLNIQHIKTEIKSEPEIYFSDTATVIMTPASKDIVSPDRIDSLTEHYAVTSQATSNGFTVLDAADEMVDRKPIIICPPTDEPIIIDDDDESKLQSWIRRLAPRSDSAYRQQSSSSRTDKTESAPPETSVPAAVKQPSVSPVDSSPVNNDQTSVCGGKTKDSGCSSASIAKKSKIDKLIKSSEPPKSSSAKIPPSSSPDKQKDVSPAPEKDEEVRLQRVVKRRQSVVVERSIKVIDVLSKPKRRKSYSESRTDHTESAPPKTGVPAAVEQPSVSPVGSSPVDTDQTSVCGGKTKDSGCNSASIAKKSKIDKVIKPSEPPKASSTKILPSSLPAKQKDVSPAPEKDEEVRLQRVVKRRQSVVGERSIKVIDALSKPERRKSDSESSHNVKSDRKSVDPDHLKSQDEERKSKLQKVDESAKKPIAATVRTHTKPKVKITINNRSAFLADLASLPPKPSEIKQKNYNKTPSAANSMSGCGPSSPVNSACMSAIKIHTPRPKLTEAARKVIKEFIGSNTSANTHPFGIITGSVTNNVPPPLSNPAQDEITPAHEHAKGGVRSILRRPGAPHSGRSVRFAEQLTKIREFHSVSPEPDAIDIPPPPSVAIVPPVVSTSYDALRDRSIRNLRDPKSNPVNEILTSLTGWNPDWLQKESSQAKINATDVEPLTLRNNYVDLANYLRNVVPLMKLELWEFIHSGYKSMRTMAPIKITVNSAFSEHHNRCLRHVFHCKFVSDHVRLTDYGSLLLVSYSQGSIIYKCFAIVTQTRIVCNESSRTVLFTMESSNGMANALRPETPFVQIQIVSQQLFFEMNMFRAVMQLDTSPLLQQILRPRDFPMSPVMDTMSFVYKGDQDLSAKQLQIVRHISCAPPNGAITLIEGPPGSGKSHVIVNLLTHLMCGGAFSIKTRRILLCADSHGALDEICRSLLRVRRRQAQPLFSLVRFGQQNQMHADVKCRSLESLAKRPRPLSQLEDEKSCIKLKIAAMRFSDINPVQRQYDTQYFTERLDDIEKAIIRARSNLPAENSHHDDVYRFLLGRADIICSTLTNSSSLIRFISNVDLCIIDQATNCTETHSLMPLQLGVRSLVLVGDSHQHPDSAISPKACQLGLHRSLFHRICSAFAEQPNVAPVFLLQRQYRMHPEICAWPRQQFYGDRMQNDAVAAGYAARFPLRPYVMLNILLANDNSVETRFLERMLRVLAPYVKDSTVGVVLPKMVPPDLLTDKLRGLPIQSLTVKSVDDYKGQEFDVIVLFNPRSYGMGFMDQPQCLKVALTRARKCLILCGYFTNMMKSDMCKSMFVDAMQRKCFSDMENIENDVNFEKAIVDHLVKPEYKRKFVF